VYSFFDIQLTYYRNNIFLGTLLGVASTIIGTHREFTPDTPKVETEVQSNQHWLIQPTSEKVFFN
ncbi:MAG: hypothetical protein HY708_00820, partial [Ignavibacteriae bacterium]|nr:hypothetical protein [Ignavibacteriota bacterium]